MENVVEKQTNFVEAFKQFLEDQNNFNLKASSKKVEFAAFCGVLVDPSKEKIIYPGRHFVRHDITVSASINTVAEEHWNVIHSLQLKGSKTPSYAKYGPFQEGAEEAWWQSLYKEVNVYTAKKYRMITGDEIENPQVLEFIKHVKAFVLQKQTEGNLKYNFSIILKYTEKLSLSVLFQFHLTDDDGNTYYIKIETPEFIKLKYIAPSLDDAKTIIASVRQLYGEPVVDDDCLQLEFIKDIVPSMIAEYQGTGTLAGDKYDAAKIWDGYARWKNVSCGVDVSWGKNDVELTKKLISLIKQQIDILVYLKIRKYLSEE